MGTPAEMVRFNEANDKWGLSDEEVFAGDGWLDRSRDGCSRFGRRSGRQGTAPPRLIVAPIYDWTGFYIGVNGGWGESNSCLNFDAVWSH